MSKQPATSGQHCLLDQIRKELAEADKLCGNWGLRDGQIDDEEQEVAGALVQSAFEKSLVLMEMIRLPQTRDRIREIYDQARKNLTETKYSINLCEPYLVWSYNLSQILEAPEIVDSWKHNSALEQDLPSAVSRVEHLCDAFHRTALKLKTRHANRPGLEISDEYDVQYLLAALLQANFSDIRPEEWTPSYAGKCARMDFLLKDESIVIETKMARDGLTDGRLGDELIVDIARYKNHPDCKALFCFVYDPMHLLKNPTALETDLSRKTDGLIVQVQVRPRQ